MNLPDSLRAEVRDLEAKIGDKGREAATAEENRAQKQQEAEKLYETMGWRERYIRGFLGGDRDAVRRHRELTGLTAHFNTIAAQKREDANILDQQLCERVHEHLRQNDAAFRSLLVPQRAAQELQDAVAGFLSTIDSALSEIDDAQSMETMDLFSKNKGIALMSTLANSEAKSAIRAVEEAAPDFQRAVDTYNETMKKVDLGDLKFEIGDTMDLVFDLAFDGFDFMSIFTLSALGDAEDGLKAARAKVDEVGDIAATHLAKADSAVTACIDRARRSCRP